MYEEEQLITMKQEAFEALTPTKKFDISNKVMDAAYSDDGKGLLVSAENYIHVYDLHEGTLKQKPIECAKYGVKLVKFAGPDCLHSSTKQDHMIRLLNLSNLSYTRYFPGHTKDVNCIEMHPRNDATFLTSSLDNTIRVWDRRTFENVGFIDVHNVPLVAYDPEGLIFAVAFRNDTIKLFDVRSYDLGPFQTFRVMKNDDDEWTKIEFSPCGKFILVSTKASGVKWIDAFVGKVVHDFRGHHNSHRIPLQATVSTDSSLVFVGSDDRQVYAYSTRTGDVAFKLQTPSLSISHLVAFNHKQFLMTTLSMSREVILWAPNEEYSV